MFRNNSIAGSWRDLLARLEDRGALAVWAGEDDRLAGVGDVEADLLPLLARGADPARADDLWAALIRQAARDGGDDLDAVMLLVHLSSDWVLATGRQLRDLAPDIAGVLVSELACRIRTYPWRTRPGSVAGNLRLDTRHAVLAEFRPSVRNRPGLGEYDLAPDSADWHDTPLGVCVPGPDDETDIDVLDLLLWAARAGVDEDDLKLLIRTERARADANLRAADRVVAAEFGLSRATFHRRRARALGELRDVARSYLAAVA